MSREGRKNYHTLSCASHSAVEVGYIARRNNAPGSRRRLFPLLIFLLRRGLLLHRGDQSRLGLQYVSIWRLWFEVARRFLG